MQRHVNYMRSDFKYQEKNNNNNNNNNLFISHISNLNLSILYNKQKETAGTQKRILWAGHLFIMNLLIISKNTEKKSVM